jgi:urea transport system permease protein
MTFQDQIFLQFLTGFSVVAILVIAAIGLAIIFGIAGVINMAHGEFIMIGAYSGYVLQQYVVGPNFTYTLFLAIPMAFIVVGLLGLIVERTIIQWIYDRPLETLLATWGWGIALQVIVKLIFGTELKEAQVPDILEGGIRIIGFVRYPYYRIFLIIVAILLIIGVFYLLYRTNLGLKVRAVRRNRRMASCLGIDTARVDMTIFVIGSGLAGVAGAILAPIKTVSPTMGFFYAVDSCSAGSGVCGGSLPAPGLSAKPRRCSPS